VTVSGVKWTTARRVACDALDRIYGPAPAAPSDVPEPLAPSLLEDVQAAGADGGRVVGIFERLVEEESVVWLDDLLLRRMEGLDTDEAVLAAARAGLRALAGRPGSQAEHLRRLRAALESVGDPAAAALGPESGEASPVDPRRRAVGDKHGAGV